MGNGVDKSREAFQRNSGGAQTNTSSTQPKQANSNVADYSQYQNIPQSQNTDNRSGNDVLGTFNSGIENIGKFVNNNDFQTPQFLIDNARGLGNLYDQLAVTLGNGLDWAVDNGLGNLVGYVNEDAGNWIKDFATGEEIAPWLKTAGQLGALALGPAGVGISLGLATADNIDDFANILAGEDENGNAIDDYRAGAMLTSGLLDMALSAIPGAGVAANGLRAGSKAAKLAKGLSPEGKGIAQGSLSEAEKKALKEIKNLKTAEGRRDMAIDVSKQQGSKKAALKEERKKLSEKIGKDGYTEQDAADALAKFQRENGLVNSIRKSDTPLAAAIDQLSSVPLASGTLRKGLTAAQNLGLGTASMATNAAAEGGQEGLDQLMNYYLGGNANIGDYANLAAAMMLPGKRLTRQLPNMRGGRRFAPNWDKGLKLSPVTGSYSGLNEAAIRSLLLNDIINGEYEQARQQGGE